MNRTTRKTKAAVSRRREPKRDKGKRTKALIRDAIIDLVSDAGHGLQEIKLSRICEKAGVTIGSFYFHFENKEAAIEEVAIDELEQTKKTIDNIPHQTDLHSELRQFILAYLVRFVERPKQTRLVFNVIRSNPAVHAAYVSGHFQISKRLQALLAPQRESTTKTDEQVFLVAEFLLAGVESFMENLYTWEDSRFAKIGKSPELIADKLATIWCAVAATGAET